MWLLKLDIWSFLNVIQLLERRWSMQATIWQKDIVIPGQMSNYLKLQFGPKTSNSWSLKEIHINLPG